MSAVSTAKKKTKTRIEEIERLPGNPKYQNVKALVDSGSNVRKYLEKVKESHKSQKQDEIFKRIRLSTFVTLMIQSGKENVLETETDEVQEDVAQYDEEMRTMSRLSSVISGIGELDLKNGGDSLISFKPSRKMSCPYLLLDVRDTDDYHQHHIVTAKSYPTMLLCRTCNYETKELLYYKNRTGTIIILYDYDETLARRAATTLVQRGYDNMYLLTGGLKLAAEKFTAGFVTGKFPNREMVVGDKDMLTTDDITILQVQLDRYLMASAGNSHLRPFSKTSTTSTMKSKSPAWR